MESKAKFSEEELRQVDQRARRQINDIRRLLAPDLRGMMRAQVTVESAAAHRDSLPAKERELFDLNVSLALADLTTLQDSLRQYRDLIAAEIRQHHCAKGAAAAYGQAAAKYRRVS